MGERLPRVTAVTVLQNRSVRIGFSDGTERTVDLSPYLWGPVFAEIRDDDAAFAEVAVDHELGTLVWPNGADIDPLVLHGDAIPESRPGDNPAA